MAQSAKEPFQYSAAPRAVNVNARRKYRDATADETEKKPINILHDPRVIRGSTLPPKRTVTEEQQEMFESKKRASNASSRPKQQVVNVDKPRTPEPVQGRLHMDVQTDVYLEELSDRPPESTIETQTDQFLERPTTPQYVPMKSGQDAETQILAGELFNFDAEIQPILDILIGKSIESAMIEVLEEEELASLRQRQRIRDAELAEVQRLEEKERRKFEEKERRVAQERMRVQKEAELAARVSAREVSHKFMEELMIDVFTNLDSDGFFFDPLEREVETVFMPHLLSKVESRIQKYKIARQLAMEVVKRSLEMRYFHIMGLSIWEVGAVTASAVAAVLLQRKKIPVTAMKYLNLAVYHIFMPCYSFTRVVPTLSVSSLMGGMWVLPVSCIVNIAIGFLIAIITNKIIGKRLGDFAKGFAMSLTFSNTGYLPLALLAVIAADNGIFRDDPYDMYNGEIRATAEFIAVQSPIFWSVGYMYLLGSDAGDRAMDQSTTLKPSTEMVPIYPATGSAPTAGDGPSPSPAMLAADHQTEMISVGTATDKKPMYADQVTSLSDATPGILSTAPPTVISPSASGQPAKPAKRGLPWKEVMNPPFIAFLLSVAVSLLPTDTKKSIIDSFAFEAMSALGSCAVPTSLVVFGGNLSVGPTEKLKVSTKLTVTVNSIVRYLIFPLINGFLYVWLLIKFDVLGNDQLLKMILLMESAMPTAVNLLTAVQLIDKGMAEASALVLWTYVIGIFTISGWVALFIMMTAGTDPYW